MWSRSIIRETISAKSRARDNAKVHFFQLEAEECVGNFVPNLPSDISQLFIYKKSRDNFSHFCKLRCVALRCVTSFHPVLMTLAKGLDQNSASCYKKVLPT